MFWTKYGVALGVTVLVWLIVFVQESFCIQNIGGNHTECTLPKCWYDTRFSWNGENLFNDPLRHQGYRPADPNESVRVYRCAKQ